MRQEGNNGAHKHKHKHEHNNRIGSIAAGELRALIFLVGAACVRLVVHGTSGWRLCEPSKDCVLIFRDIINRIVANLPFCVAFALAESGAEVATFALICNPSLVNHSTGPKCAAVAAEPNGKLPEEADDTCSRSL